MTSPSSQNRMDEYISEFEENGIDNLTIDI